MFKSELPPTNIHCEHDSLSIWNLACVCVCEIERRRRRRKSNQNSILSMHLHEKLIRCKNRCRIFFGSSSHQTIQNVYTNTFSLFCSVECVIVTLRQQLCQQTVLMPAENIYFRFEFRILKTNVHMLSKCRCGCVCAEVVWPWRSLF